MTRQELYSCKILYFTPSSEHQFTWFSKYLHFFDLYRTNLIWLGKNWDETKRYKNTAEAQFSSEPRKIFLFTFFDFFRVFRLFSVFSGFFSKKDETKWNTYRCLDITEPRDNTYTDTHKFSEPRNEILQVLMIYKLVLYP